MKIKAVIFDLDGTIVNTERIVWDIWYEVGEKHGIEVREEMLATITGSDPAKEQQTAASFPEFIALNEEVMATFILRIDEMRSNGGDVSTAGLYQLMAYLKDRQIPMGIASNSDREHVDKMVSMLKNNNLFEIVVTRDDVMHGKPDPEMFLTVANHFQVAPENVLVIEDSKFGIQAAKTANMPRILVESMIPMAEDTKAQANYVCHSLNEVIPILENSFSSNNN